MKINEIAVITESQELEEAPIGLLRRMGTALKGMFSASQAQESKVQSAVNSLYNEYKKYYTATPAQRATGQNLLDFLKGSGYPIGPKAPATGFKTLTDVANAAEEAEKIKNAKPQQAEPEAEPEQDNPNQPDNTIDFNKEKNKSPDQNYRDNYDKIFQKNSMYEAVDIKADTPLNDDLVKKIIEFVVRHSYATDTIKDLRPGAFTNKARTQRNKELAQQAKEKLGLTQDKDGVWSVVSAGVEYTDAPVTEGIMKFKGADGKVVSIPISTDQPTLQDLQKAQQKYGAPQSQEPSGDSEKEPTNIAGNIARGLKMGYKAGSDPLGTAGKWASDKFDDLAKSAGDKDDGSDEKMTKQGINFMKSDLGIESPNMAVKGLQKLVKGDPISNAKEREAVAPIINAVVKSLQDQNGRTRLKTLFKAVK